MNDQYNQTNVETVLCNACKGRGQVASDNPYDDDVHICGCCKGSGRLQKKVETTYVPFIVTKELTAELNKQVKASQLAGYTIDPILGQYEFKDTQEKRNRNRRR